jgi:NAD(P)-dependent dehydrogenase (short-subunit alcohol dehydrogenase family)
MPAGIAMSGLEIFRRDVMTDNVLLTGANRGIGLEMVRQYASAGWRVYACCRQPERAVELNGLARSSAGRVSVHPLDVTSPVQIAALPAILGAQPLDLLINNAGVYGQDDASFGNTDVRAWLEAFHVNAVAPLKIMEALVEPVARSRRRVMACVSSKMGSMADNRSGGSYVYRSSKAALNAVVTSAAIDLRHRGITVVALNPGWVKTDMGGPNAEITVAESVDALRALLDRLGPADSGRFIDVDGTTIPW